MTDTDRSDETKADRFLALHHGDAPLLMPNAWDAGSARLFESLGFDAVATTSSGFAATLARLDGSVSLDEAIEHSASLVAATDVPVSADLENGYADDPAGVAATSTARSAPVSPDVRSRTSPRIVPIRSMTSVSRESGSPRLPKLRIVDQRASYSPRDARTSSTTVRTSPTRSRGCSPTKRQVPTCCTHPVSARRTTYGHS